MSAQAVKKPVGRPKKSQAQEAVVSSQSYEEFVKSCGFDYSPKFKPLKDAKLPIVIKKQTSVLDKILCREPIEPACIDKAIFSDAVNQLTTHYLSKDIFKNLRSQLIAIQGKIKKKAVLVEYQINETGFGRSCPVGSLSLGVLTRPLRHALLKENWIDIDIANAQVEMLRQICEANNWDVPALSAYCINRQYFFEQVANSYKKASGEQLDVKKDRDIIKSLFIAIIFYAGFERWRFDNKIQETAKIEDCSLLEGFKRELMDIGKTILYHNKEFVNLVNNNLKEKTKTNKDGVEEKYTNPIGRAMSLLLQEWERRCLEAMYSYFKENEVITDKNEVILCYDGLMLPKKAFKSELMQGISDYVYNKTGFRLKFEIKGMEEGKRFEEELKFKTITDPKDLSKWSKPAFDSLPTYSEKKVYFERFFCRCRQPDIVYQYYFTRPIDEKERDARHFSYTCRGEFPSAWRDLKFEYWQDPENPTLLIGKFTDKWLDDEEAKISQTIDFMPRNICESDLLNEKWVEGDYLCNLFSGYSDKIKTPFDKNDIILRVDNGKGIEDISIDILLKMWLSVLKEVCEGNEDYMNYLLKVMALKIKTPTLKIPIGIILKGPQGSGKSEFIKSIGRILGERHYITSSKASDFFGEHGEGFAHKLLVNMNEVEGKDTLDLQGKMKEFITEDKISINPKFIRGYQIKNYALLVITSNKNNPVAIDILTGDRRWVVFHSTDRYVISDKEEFWKPLLEGFSKPEFTAQLYDYLMSLDLKGFNPSIRPISKSYIAMAQQSIPSIILFLEMYYRKQYNISFEDHIEKLMNSMHNEDPDFPTVARTEQIFPKVEKTMSIQEQQLREKEQGDFIKKFEQQQRDIKSADFYEEYKTFMEENGLSGQFNANSIKVFYNQLKDLDLKGCEIKVEDDTHQRFGKVIKLSYGKVFSKLHELNLTSIYEKIDMEKVVKGVKQNKSLKEYFDF